jgi:hypothetical protein
VSKYPSLLADHYAADGLAAAEPSGGDVGGVEAANERARKRGLQRELHGI